MSMSDEERVSVGVEGFDPEMSETNKGKDFVILMRYLQEFEHQDTVEKSMKFALNWESLNPQSLFNDHDITVFGWLDNLDVDDDFPRGTVVDQTLLSVRDLLDEMHTENLTRPSYLGLKITIKVFQEDNNGIEAEPEYYVEGEYNTAYESEPEPEYLEEEEEMMDIEEENELEGYFVKFDEVGTKAHGRVCTICLEEFGGAHDEDEDEDEDEEDVAVLPCQHLLHTQCFLEWSVQCGGLPTCPLCRCPFTILIS